jgi:hypothetical protein
MKKPYKHIKGDLFMSNDEYQEKQASNYIKFYIELLEEFGENYVFSPEEFDKIIQEALFSDSGNVLDYFLRNNMITSYKGGVELRLLDVQDKAFRLLPEPDQNAICSFYLKMTRMYLNK